MNAVQVESSNSRHRTQAFIATRSPDEVFGQIMSTLCPKHNFDGADVSALRHIIWSVIIAPRAPPALKRTRPDRHLGELVAAPIYSSSRGIDGPPLSANQSFYFSHRDPNFATLLPQVDRSRYRRAGKQTSRSDLDGGNAQDSQERSGTAVPYAPSAISAQSAVSTRAPISLAPMYVERNLEEIHLDRILDGPADSDETVVLKSSQKSALKGDAHTYPSKQVHFSPTATEMTTEDPEVEPTAISHESSAVPTSPQQINMIMGSVRLGQNKHIRFPEDTTNPTPSTLQPPDTQDTQDTQDSTQQSEVFSSPGSFADFTPPTQESLNDAFSQIDPPGFSQELSANSEEPESGSSKKEESASSKTPESSSSKKAEAVSSEEAVSSQEQSSPNVPIPVLGKRAHDASETSDDMPQPKRSKRSKQPMRSKHSKQPRHSMRLRSAH